MKKEKAKMDTPKTISVKCVEYYNTMIVREPVTINVEDYPELNGMSEDEMKYYISINWGDMKSTIEQWYETLYEECTQSDVLREKITGQEYECHFD